MTELKSRMSFEEFLDWQSYMEKNGPINPIARNDAAIARLGVVMGAKPEAMMPWPKEPEREQTPEEMAMILQGIAAATGAKGKSNKRKRKAK